MRVVEFDQAVGRMMVARFVELRAELARGAEPEPEAAPAKVIDFALEKARLQKRRERYIEAFADAGMTKEELRASLAKVDEARTRLDAKEAAQRHQAPLATAQRRRDVLDRVKSLVKAWKAATPAQRRELLNIFATAVRIEHGRPPVVDWRTPAELAAEEHL
jgi:hypothetical protein